MSLGRSHFLRIARALFAPAGRELLFFVCASTVGASRRRKSNQKKTHPASAPVPGRQKQRQHQKHAVILSAAKDLFSDGAQLDKKILRCAQDDDHSCRRDASASPSAFDVDVPGPLRMHRAAQQRSGRAGQGWPAQGCGDRMSPQPGPEHASSAGHPRSGCVRRGVLSLVPFFAQAKKGTRARKRENPALRAEVLRTYEQPRRSNRIAASRTT